MSPSRRVTLAAIVLLLAAAGLLLFRGGSAVPPAAPEAARAEKREAAAGAEAARGEAARSPRGEPAPAEAGEPTSAGARGSTSPDTVALVAVVQDAASRPIEGARVELRRLSGPEVSRWRWAQARRLSPGSHRGRPGPAGQEEAPSGGEALGSETSDGSGIVRFPGLDSGSYLLVATAQFHAGATRLVEFAGANQTVELSLRDELLVAGVVLSEAGAPIAGATVVAASPEADASPATSGADGSFVLRAFAAATLPITATAEGFGSGSAVSVDGAPVRIVLGGLRLVTGKVLQDGRGVAGAAVFADGAEVASSGRGGAFSVRLEDGSHRFAAAKGAARSPEEQVEVDGARGAPVLLALRAPSWLRVLAVDGAGQPLGGAEVNLALEGTGEELSGATDAAGAYRFEPIPAGVHELSVEASGRGRKELLVKLPAGRGRTLAVQLVEGQPALVRVVGAGGEPLPGTLVALRQDRSATDPGQRTGAAGPDGLARFENVPPGSYSVAASAPGRVGVETALQVPGEEAVLTLLPAGAIAGAVVDATGAAVPGAEVLAERSEPARHGRRSGEQSTARTDAAGAFRLEGIGGGSYRVRASSPGGAAELSGIAAGAAGLLLTLHPVGAISGKVLDGAGQPVEAGVIFTAPGRRHALGFSGADGAFTLEGLEPGSGVLEVRDGARSVRAEATVGDEGVVLTFPRGATIRGAVVDAARRPVPSFSVNGAQVHAEDGRFELSGLPAGPTLFQIEAEEQAPAAVTATLVADQVAELGVIQLPAATRITGEVKDSAGRPVTPCQVLAVVRYARGASHRNNRVCDGLGRFELTDLPAGSATLLVQAPEHEAVPLKLELAAGETRTVTLLVHP